MRSELTHLLSAPAESARLTEDRTKPAAIRRAGVFRKRGWVGAVLMAPVVVAVLGSPPLVREDTWAGIGLNTLGWLCFLAGAAIRVWATLFIGGRKNDELQVEGPYSICRNPLYLGSALFAIAIALFLKSVTFSFALLVVFLYYWWWVVPAEEKFLESRFGAPFKEYCRRTPRFGLRLSAFHSPPVITLSVKFLRIEAARLIRAVLVPVVLTLLMQLRESPWWPVWLHFP